MIECKLFNYDQSELENHCLLVILDKKKHRIVSLDKSQWIFLSIPVSAALTPDPREATGPQRSSGVGTGVQAFVVAEKEGSGL